MTLTWHKVTTCEGIWKYSRHDPCRSIGFISIWYGFFAQRSEQWQIFKNLTLDPTCDTISDVLMKFGKIFEIFMPGAIKYRFRIENPSTSLVDGMGGGGRNAPSPYPSAGKVREYPIGAQVNTLAEALVAPPLAKARTLKGLFSGKKSITPRVKIECLDLFTSVIMHHCSIITRRLLVSLRITEKS